MSSSSPNFGSNETSSQQLAHKLNHAFAVLGKVTKKTAKSSYQKTKYVARHMPGKHYIGRMTSKMTKSVMGGRMMNSLSSNTTSLRHMFKASHREELGVPSSTTSETDSVASEDSADAHFGHMTIEEMRENELVEEKYFDSSYDAAAAEVALLPATYTDDIALEIRRLSEEVRKREQQLRIVDAALRRRILDNYDHIVKGVCKIHDVHDDLRETGGECRKARLRLQSNRKTFIHRGLSIPFMMRRKSNLKGILHIVDAMQLTHSQYTKLLGLIESGSFLKAIGMAKKQRALRPQQQSSDDDAGNNKTTTNTKNTIANGAVTAVTSLRAEEEALRLEVVGKIKSMEECVYQWRRITDDDEFILCSVDERVEGCLRNRFDENRYMGSMEAYCALGDEKSGVNRVVGAMVQLGEQLVTKCVGEVSLKRNGRTIEEVVSGVEPEHLLPCMCQVCGKGLDYIVLHRQIHACHQDAYKAASTTNANANASVNSVVVADQNDGTFTAQADVETLRRFHKNMMKINGEMGDRLAVRLHQQFTELLHGANLQPLELDKVLHLFFISMMFVEATSMLQSSKDALREALAAARSSIKNELIQWVETGYHPLRANQVLQLMTMDPWIADEFATVGQFKSVKPLSPATYRDSTRFVKSYVVHREADAQANPFYSENFVASSPESDVAVEPIVEDPSHNILTGAAVLVGNMMFEYLLRMVIRFPPIALEVMEWIQELFAIYVYVAAANFISPSRATPLEEQSDFSPPCRAVLGSLRERCLKAMPYYASAGSSAFPPPVFDAIKHLYGSRESFFAISHRITAVASAVPLIQMLQSHLATVSPLLPISVSSAQQQALQGYRSAVEELIHVGLHRFAIAVFDLEWCVSDIKHARFHEEKDELRPSAYVDKFRTELQQFVLAFNRTVQFPSLIITKLFWRRLVFAVQTTLTRAYSQANPKKINDRAVTQMTVDAQAINQIIKAMQHTFISESATSTPMSTSTNTTTTDSGNDNDNDNTKGTKKKTVGGGGGPFNALLVPDYVTSFLKLFFYDEAYQVQWLRQQGAACGYSEFDLVHWLPCGDKDRRKVLEGILREIGHTGQLLIEPFRDLDL